MGKIFVTPVSTRANFKHGKETYHFGDVFTADDKDKKVLSSLGARVLRKVHKEKDPVKEIPSSSDKKTES